jgi:hypothetical protein
MRTNIEWKGISLVVYGNYYAGFMGTHEQPPEAPEYEINKVLLKGVNITELLDDYGALDDLEEACMEQIKEQE